MTYFLDLTPYQYTELDENDDIPTLNIGWLAKSKPYPTGETSEEFKLTLEG